jgi:ribosome-binding protein aMBF1 (putative translation factor)
MKETGIFFATISKIERGWLIPTEKQKKQLADALKMKVSWVFPRKKKF